MLTDQLRCLVVVLVLRFGVASISRTGAKLRNLKVNEEQPRSQSRRRRFYDEEFKRNAVELLEAGGRSAVQLNREVASRTVL